MGPQDLLDALDEIVYVSDPNTYELLYANRRCRSLLPTRDYKGKPCYALLQGQPAPCPYCTNARLLSLIHILIMMMAMPSFSFRSIISSRI